MQSYSYLHLLLLFISYDFKPIVLNMLECIKYVKAHNVQWDYRPYTINIEYCIDIKIELD